MWRLLAALWTLFVATLTFHQTTARAPKFAIGEDLRAFHRTHHIEGEESVADAYHVYVKENTKALIVEPAIRVLPLDDELHGKKLKQADVCDYKILPRVTGHEANINVTTESNVEDVPDEQQLKRHRARRAQLEEDEYQDDEEQEEDEDAEPSQELPFTIRASKENKHEAVLESTKNLNCEHKAKYEFDIVAVSCSGDVSTSARVKVEVEDVNEYEPKFAKSEYTATIEEGVVTHSIVQVQAFDEDCDTALFGNIKRYELIDTKGAPFYIDELGNIGNLRALNYTHEKNFVLTVVAYDGGNKRSLYPATVRIEVKPVCATRWEGIPPRVDYTTETSPVPLYNDAKLDLCTASLKETTGCEKIEKITGHVTLNNDHIGKGCDREDKLPLEVQRKRCSTKTRPHSSLIELLPNKPSPSSKSHYPKVDSNGSITHGSNILKFDGVSTAIVLTSDKISPDTFNRSFTITTWLKREAPLNKTFDHKYPKENILCISDDHERSRHHVSVYVRNCRLSLLLRREPKAGDQVTVFRPAEWRWDLEEQLCGGNWHHYAISVKYPDVKLFIDGKEFEDDAATEIIDDWALHPIKGLQTTTVVGACWQGAQHRMDQFLKGYLDGLAVLVNDTEEETVLQCMQKCAERLTVPESASSAQAVFSMLDSDENEMLVEGYDVTAFQNLIRQIGYENDRMYPTPGVRFVELRTSYQCKSATKNGTVQTITKNLPDISLRVEVAEAAPPVISLSGPSSLTIDGMENADALVLRTGMKILDSLTISVMRSAAHSDDKEAKVAANVPDYASLVKKFSREIILLDMCTLTLRNDNKDEEVTLVVSDELAKPLKMDVRQIKDSPHEKQWSIQGSGVNNEIPDFLTVLRDVRLKFVDEKAPTHSEILLQVGLTCVEMFSRIPSAEYSLQVDLKNFEHVEKTVEMHTMAASGSVRRSIQQSNMVMHKEHISIDHPSIARVLDVDAFYGPRSVFSVPQYHASGDSNHLGSNGIAITSVVVVCVAVMIVVIVVGIIKIRVIQKQDRDHDLQDIHSRAKKAMPHSLNAFGKLRKTFKKRQTGADFEHEDFDLEDGDVERGTATKPKSDMAWDDGGMSITINPLETMQVGGGVSDADYDEHEDDDEYEREYDESEEEPEVQGPGRLVQEDEDSANECEECTKPNREGTVHTNRLPEEPLQSLRRSQSCVETVSKGRDNRMTRSELEWDDQI